MSGLKDKMSAAEFREYLKTNEATRQRKARQGKPEKNVSDDSKLWAIFSKFIRLKFSDEKGFCTCYTCGRIGFWSAMDCGHGISRQHLATKFDERNNRPQCGPCNGFEGGRREVFKEKMDQEHGAGTWDRMELKARGVYHRSDFDFEVMIKYYSEEVKKLKKEKGLK